MENEQTPGFPFAQGAPAPPLQQGMPPAVAPAPAGAPPPPAYSSPSPKGLYPTATPPPPAAPVGDLEQAAVPPQPQTNPPARLNLQKMLAALPAILLSLSVIASVWVLSYTSALQKRIPIYVINGVLIALALASLVWTVLFSVNKSYFAPFIVATALAITAGGTTIGLYVALSDVIAGNPGDVDGLALLYSSMMIGGISLGSSIALCIAL